jgi:hypothetical protein
MMLHQQNVTITAANVLSVAEFSATPGTNKIRKLSNHGLIQFTKGVRERILQDAKRRSIVETRRVRHDHKFSRCNV